jgi:hypothetical protein
MIVYRMKHLPTGLYYCPSREIQVETDKGRKYVKSNLSKKGKVYVNKPSVKYIGDKFYDHTLPPPEKDWMPRMRQCVESEWLIEEIVELI